MKQQHLPMMTADEIGRLLGNEELLYQVVNDNVSVSQGQPTTRVRWSYSMIPSVRSTPMLAIICFTTVSLTGPLPIEPGSSSPIISMCYPEPT